MNDVYIALVMIATTAADDSIQSAETVIVSCANRLDLPYCNNSVDTFFHGK